MPKIFQMAYFKKLLINFFFNDFNLHLPPCQLKFNNSKNVRFLAVKMLFFPLLFIILILVIEVKKLSYYFFKLTFYSTKYKFIKFLL